MAAGLVKGEGFAVDASVMEANASRYHGKAPHELEWTDEQKQRRAVSAWTAKANKRVLFGYGLNYLIDVEHAVIVDVEATPARTYDEIDEPGPWSIALRPAST